MELERIKRVAVIGAGLMGHGIAQDFSTAGYQVGLHDVGDEPLKRAMASIRVNLDRMAALGVHEGSCTKAIMGRITTSTSLADVVAGADLVVEAIFEDLDQKNRMFRSLEEVCGPEVILASNTSSFVPSKLAIVLRQPERFLVAHYFNPPYLLPLVEVVPGQATSEATIDTVVGLLRKIGKQPVLIRKEATGFVGNRLQFALFREALAIVEQGIATPDEVDRVVRFGFGRRLAGGGPFEIFDLAGLDTLLAVASQILPDLHGAGKSGPAVPDLLSRKVERGELGVKSGRGFHEWTPEAADELRRRLLYTLTRVGEPRS